MSYLSLSWSSVRRSGFFLFVIICLAVFPDAAVFAAQNPPKPETPAKEDVVQAEPVLVTASRVEQPLSMVTVPYSIVPAQEIEERKNPQALEYLRDLPGVNVAQRGAAGRDADIYIRGANANHTLVLIDGARVNSPTTGAFNFSGLSSANIERIEVIRGPQSALYGSDAIGGVVNIITKKGTGPLNVTGKFECGTYHSFDEEATLNGRWDKISVSGSFSRLDDNGPSINSGNEATNVSTRLGVEFAKQLDWDTVYRYNLNAVGIDDGPFRVDPNAFSRSKENVVTTKLQGVLENGWDHSVQLSADTASVLSYDPPDPDTRQAPYATKLNTNIYDIVYQNSLPLWDFMTLTSGVEYEYQYANNKLYHKIYRSVGVYAEDQMVFWDRWHVTGGLRLEKNQDFGTVATANFSQLFDIKETGSKIKVGFGKGFRAPTLNQLYYPGYGTPSLLPERSTNYDVGWEQALGKNGSFEIDLFHNSLKNLIQSVPVNGVYLATNLGKAKIDRMELQTLWTVVHNFDLRMYYDLLLTQDKSVDCKELIRRPRHAGGVTARLRFWDRWTCTTDAVFVGTSRDRTGLRGRPEREVNPGYGKMDLTLSYDWSKLGQIYGRLENVTDSIYSEVLGYKTLGTIFFIGVKVDWAVQ